MEQLLLHLIGDYITQSDWMANNKTSKYLPAMTHAIVYSLPFLLLRPSVLAFSVILGTHFLIDRFRLAKYVVWFKNAIGSPRLKRVKVWTEGDNEITHTTYYVDPKLHWDNCKATGYPSETPAWLAVWLMIIADNTMHLTINYLALKYL